MKNIFNFKLNDKYSVTTKNVDLMNIYTPLNAPPSNTKSNSSGKFFSGIFSIKLFINTFNVILF